MKYEEHLRRISFAFVEHRLDGFGDQVGMYQIAVDGQPVGCVVTWDKANRTRAWLGTALTDLEALFRTPVTPAAVSAGTP